MLTHRSIIMGKFLNPVLKVALSFNVASADRLESEHDVFPISRGEKQTWFGNDDKFQ